MTLPRLFGMLLMTLLAGCAAAPPQDAVYPLRPEQRVALGHGLVLTYDSFSDSRCPANTRCVWAGRLIFRFLIDGPDGVAVSMTPEAAEQTARSLLVAAEQAAGQLASEGHPS